MKQKIKTIVLATIFCTGLISPASVEAGWLAGSARRALAKRVASATTMKQIAAKKILAKQAIRGNKQGSVTVRQKNQAIQRWDAARDKTLPVKKMEQSRTVSRFTSIKQARMEQLGGIAPKTHMTAAKVHPGRPLSRATARDRYGLFRKPNAVMTVTIPKGQPVRRGKVVAGQGGYGEITSTRRIGPEHIKDVRRLK